jgi:hypothetical protein
VTGVSSSGREIFLPRVDRGAETALDLGAEAAPEETGPAAEGPGAARPGAGAHPLSEAGRRTEELAAWHGAGWLGEFHGDGIDAAGTYTAVVGERFVSHD